MFFIAIAPGWRMVNWSIEQEETDTETSTSHMQTWQLYENNMILNVLDPTISWSNEMIEESLRVIELALLCTHSRPNLRPTMTAIMSILAGGCEVKIPKLDKLDVRNYADLDLNSSSTSADRIRFAALQPSTAYTYEPSSRSDQSIVSALEPR